MSARGENKVIREVERYGERGRGRIAVKDEWVHGTHCYRVHYRDLATGQRKVESFEHSRDGKARALTFAAGLVTKRRTPQPADDALPCLTVRELWEAFLLVHAPADRGGTGLWREKTYSTEGQRWRLFESFVGFTVRADTVKLETLDGFVAALVAEKRFAYQIRRAVGTVRQVFRWGVQRRRIPPSEVPTYTVKLGKDHPSLETQEFDAADRRKILSAWDPRSSREWRPWVATVLHDQYGARQNAVLHLAWADVSVRGGTVTWRPEWDKQGAKGVMPLTPLARKALAVARYWRWRAGYAGPWLFFRPGIGARDLSNGRSLSTRQKNRSSRKADNPWTAQSYAERLAEACAKVGVQRAKYQGSHAHRRGLVGDIIDAGGSVDDAAEYIRDRDVSVVRRSYKLRREGRVTKTAALVEKITEHGGEQCPD